MWILFVIYVLSCLFTAALWSPAEKGLVSWLSCVCHFPMWCPGSGVVLDCIYSGYLPSSLLGVSSHGTIQEPCSFMID